MSGRNFEYFSEDSYLGGTMCGNVIKACEAKGVVCYLKHFAMNDQETDRLGICTFAKEQAIREVYQDEPRIEVKPYYGLAVDFAKAENAHFIVKGVRSVKDFEYEREQADINRQLAGIETILLYAEPHLSSISSTMVRELQHFGVDVTPYLPHKTH